MNPGPIPLNPPVTGVQNPFSWGLCCVFLGIFVLVYGRIRHKLPWVKKERLSTIEQARERSYGPVVEATMGIILILGGISLMFS